MSTKSIPDLDGVSETLLIPLYTRAIESGRPDALIKDEKAVAMVAQFNYDFSRIALHGDDAVEIIMRVREFDRHAREFQAHNPDAVVVHIGCGLDTRFERVDNGRVEWHDLDLPPVIELRRKLIGGEGPRYHLLSGSVFDEPWLETLSSYRPRPFMFLAEGVLPYFEEAQVRSLIVKLRGRFPGAEFVCDAQTPFIIWGNNLQLAWMRVGARLRWGLKNSRDVEAWGDGIRLLDEWFYFDRPEPRLGVSQWLRYFPLLAKSAGIFHYQLGSRAGNNVRLER
jgi:O-methyltransferase involved in polyketide biosynthesis